MLNTAEKKDCSCSWSQMQRLLRRRVLPTEKEAGTEDCCSLGDHLSSSRRKWQLTQAPKGMGFTLGFLSGTSCPGHLKKFAMTISCVQAGEWWRGLPSCCDFPVQAKPLNPLCTLQIPGLRHSQLEAQSGLSRQCPWLPFL